MGVGPKAVSDLHRNQTVHAAELEGMAKTRAAGPAVQLARLAIPRESDTPRVDISFRSKLDAGTAIFTAIPLIRADATFTPTISIASPFKQMSGAPESPGITAQSCTSRPFGRISLTPQSVSAVIMNCRGCPNPPTMSRLPMLGVLSASERGLISRAGGCANVNIAQSPLSDVSVLSDL
jgi:hypothetical protein